MGRYYLFVYSLTQLDFFHGIMEDKVSLYEKLVSPLLEYSFIFKQSEMTQSPVF